MAKASAEAASAEADRPKASIIQFRRSVDHLPEVDLPLPVSVAPNGADRQNAVQAIDLSGKPKVWFTLGRGRIGKTTMIRWASETSDARGGVAICAAADPVNRSLRIYREDVAEPPTTDPAGVAEWLQELLLYTLRERVSAFIDLGGGDTSLHRLLQTMPDLADVMEAEGVAPVAMHVIGTDPHDLVPLATMEAAGFKPKATAIVCNEITGRPDDFVQVLRHKAVQGALARGAVQLWMPALTPSAAKLVDAHRLHFTRVGNTLGPFAGASVRMWLKAMKEAFAPIASWLPDQARDIAG
jgi:hypothetical protein